MEWVFAFQNQITPRAKSSVEWCWYGVGDFVIQSLSVIWRRGLFVVKELISVGTKGRKNDMVAWGLEVVACWRDICTKTYQSSKIMSQQHPKPDPDAEH